MHELQFAELAVIQGTAIHAFDWMLQSSSGQRPKHSVEMLARFSDLQVGTRELSFLFMQVPTENQSLWCQARDRTA